MAFNPDGRRLAIAASFHTVCILDTTTGLGVLTLTGHSARVSGVATVPMAGGSLPPGRIGPCRVWDASNGAEILCLRGHTASILGVAFSPDGRRLASCSGGSGGKGRPIPGEVVIWDLSKGAGGPDAARAHRPGRQRRFHRSDLQPRRRTPGRERGPDRARLERGDRGGNPHAARARGIGHARGVQSRRPSARLRESRRVRQGLGRGHRRDRSDSPRTYERGAWVDV